MSQKFVTFEVAKALKEAGYWDPGTIIKCSYNNGCYIDDGRFYENGCVCPWDRLYPAPTYIDAWLWIATRGIKEAKMPSGVICRTMSEVYVCFKDSGETAEDDFVKSVEYVIENNLIK